MKKGLQSLAKFLAILAAMVFLLNLLIDNPYAHRLARNAINSQLTESSGLKLEFESIHIRLVPLSLDVYGVKLVAKDFPEEPLLRMARLYARVSFLSLFLGKPRLAVVEAQELKAEWPPRPEILELLTPKTPHEGPVEWPPAFDVPVNRVRLKDAGIQLRAAPAAPGEPALLTAVLKGIDVDAAWRAWDDIDGKVQVNEAKLSFKDRPMLTGTRVDVDAKLRGETVKAPVTLKGKDLDARADLVAALRVDHKPRGRFLRGAADVLDAVDLSGDLAAEADLSPLAAVINAEATDGPVSGKGRITGRFPVSAAGEGTWGLAIEAASHGARIDDFQLYDSTAKLLIDADQLTFAEAHIREKGAAYGTGSGYLRFDDAVSLKFRIHPERLPLDRLLNALKVPDFTAVNAYLTGRDVILAGQGDPFGLKVDGDVRLDEFTVAGRPGTERFPLPRCNVHLALRIDDHAVKVPSVPGSCHAVPGSADGKGAPEAKAGAARKVSSARATKPARGLPPVPATAANPGPEATAPDAAEFPAAAAAADVPLAPHPDAASPRAGEGRDAWALPPLGQGEGLAFPRDDASPALAVATPAASVPAREPAAAQAGAGAQAKARRPVVPVAPEKGDNLRFSGEFRYAVAEGMNFRIDAHGLPSEALRAFSGVDHRGPVTGAVTVAGPYDRLMVDVSAAAPRWHVFGVAFRDVTAKARYDVEGNLLSLPHLAASPEEGGDVEVQGMTLKLERDYFMTGAFRVHEVPSAFVAPMLGALSPGTRLGFRVRSLDATVALPLTKPLAGKGDLSFALEDATLYERALFGEARGRLTNAGEGWKVPLAEVVNKDVVIRLAADHERRPARPAKEAAGDKRAWNPLRAWGIPDDDGLSLKAELDYVPRSLAARHSPNSFADLPYVGEGLAAVDLAGTAKLSVELAGTAAHLQGSFVGGLEKLRLFKSPVAPIRVVGSYRDGIVDVDRIEQAGNTIAGRLEVDVMDPRLPYASFVSFRQLDMRALVTERFFRDPRNFAYVDGEWELKGHLTDWWTSRGHITLRKAFASYAMDGSGRSQSLEVALAEPVTLDLKPEGWDFRDGRSLRLVGNELNVTVDARGNALPDAMNIAWRGNLRIGLLRRLFPAIETGKGEVEFEGAVAGSLVDPDVTLKVRDKKLGPTDKAWEPLTIGFSGLNPAFSNIEFEAGMEDGLVRLTRLQAKKGANGTVTASGVFNPGDPLLDDTRISIDLKQVELNRFAVPVLGNADAVLNGNFVLSGRAAPFKLSGNAEFAKAQAFGNFDLRDQILDLIRRKRFSTSAAPSEPLLTFDVQVGANDSVKIRNRSLMASLSSDLIILGDDNAPVVIGQVKVNKGTFNYKRTFDITRGNITFDEPVSPPDPKLDIAGEATISQYRVQTLITGYSSNPVVTLSVDPPNRPDGTPISKIDIIYLLSSGSLPKVERGDNTGSAAARSEAFNLLIGQFEEPVEKLFDLTGQSVIRQVYLDTYPAESDGRPVARLNLPINVRDDVSLILQVDDDSNTKVSTEYSINDNISVTGSFDKKKEDNKSKANPLPADTGVDLRFRFNFP